jgi:hypothetical protein
MSLLPTMAFRNPWLSGFKTATKLSRQRAFRELNLIAGPWTRAAMVVRLRKSGLKPRSRERLARHSSGETSR